MQFHVFFAVAFRSGLLKIIAFCLYFVTISSGGRIKSKICRGACEGLRSAMAMDLLLKICPRMIEMEVSEKQGQEEYKESMADAAEQHSSI